MRAWKKPLRGKPGVEPFLVELIARTGNNKITVRGVNDGAQHFAADRFLLYSVENRGQRITEEEFNRLPWRGTGPDPVKADFEELVDFAARPA